MPCVYHHLIHLLPNDWGRGLMEPLKRLILLTVLQVAELWNTLGTKLLYRHMKWSLSYNVDTLKSENSAS